MADSSEPTHDDAQRLEAALERIVHAKHRRQAAQPAQDTAQLAGRLEALIAEIRGALGRDSAD